jgi:predicted glycoside hydrolase/deacetylase ChbG (UPF0249 family)
VSSRHLEIVGADDFGLSAGVPAAALAELLTDFVNV